MEQTTKRLLTYSLPCYTRHICNHLSTSGINTLYGGRAIITAANATRSISRLSPGYFLTKKSTSSSANAGITQLSHHRIHASKLASARRSSVITAGDISDTQDAAGSGNGGNSDPFRAVGARTTRRYISTSNKTIAQSATLTGAPDSSAWMSTSSVTLGDSASMPAPLKSNVHVNPPVERGIFDFFKEADFTRTRASFRFDHAVAGFAKHPNRPVAPDTEIFLSERFGEDACFRRHDSLGVADGVGGITQLQGGDSSIISRKIMHYSCVELERYDNIEDEAFGSYYIVDPVSVLSRSYDRAIGDMQELGIEGATTACLAVLRDDELRIANLGDSGVLVLRRGDFVFRTEAQQRSFNVPYQLGYPTRDKPTDAQHFTVKLERGDIVVVATDGMFDNLFDEDIIDEVTKCIRANTRGAANPVDISHALASRARDVSEDSRYATSPFQSRAVAEGFYYQGGGKLDDITVIVAVVSDLEDTPDRR